MDWEGESDFKFKSRSPAPRSRARALLSAYSSNTLLFIGKQLASRQATATSFAQL